jgi:hypothetical protein
VGSLRQDLERLAADARREDPEAARALGEAARGGEESNLQAKILYSRGVVEQREKELARVFERGLEEDLEAVRRRVANAAEAAEQLGDRQGMEEALDRAQELVRGVESLDRRLEGGGRPGARAGEPGEEGDSTGAGDEATGRRLGDRPGQPGDEAGEAQGGQRGQESDREGQQGARSGEPRGGEQAGAPQGEGGRAGQRGTQGGEPQRGGEQGGGGDAIDPSGNVTPFGGASRGDPRRFTDEEARQFRREFEERWREAGELREALREAGEDTEDLDRALEALDRLRDVQTYQDLPQVALLRETLRESLGRLEFTLRRQVEGDVAGRAALRGSDDVPPGFRRLVEEYYRSLARGGREGGGGG